MLRIRRETNGRIKAQYSNGKIPCETKEMLKWIFNHYGQYLNKDKNYSAGEFAEIISKYSSLSNRSTKKCYDFLMQFNNSANNMLKC